MEQSKRVPEESGPEVPGSWLREFQSSREARYLERLDGDLEVINDLRIDGFQGPRWEAFTHILIAYSFQVLRTWLRRGIIFEKCAQKGIRFFSGTPKLQSFPYDEAEDLAQEVLQEAIDRFKTDVLIPGAWDPRRGASLKTYFIGQCLLRFPKAYSRWYTQHSASAQAQSAAIASLDVGHYDPAIAAVAGASVHRFLDELDPDTRVIVELRVQKYTFEEIAELLDSTPSAIKSKLHRLKQRREGGAA